MARKIVSAIQRAINAIGSVAALAKAINRTSSAICQWRVTRVPLDACPAIERATNGLITCEELRPDVRWGRCGLGEIIGHFVPVGDK